MPNDKDLFAEEQSMVSMSFGDHIEDLRYRLILAIVGLVVGLVASFIPIPMLGDSLGMYVFNTMQLPAKQTLDEFYRNQAARESNKAAVEKKLGLPVATLFSAKGVRRATSRGRPRPPPDAARPELRRHQGEADRVDLDPDGRRPDPRSGIVQLSEPDDLAGAP